MAKFLYKNIFNIFIVFLIVLNVLPLLAPIFSHLGLDILAKPIYFVYSYSCHQFHWRSIHIYENQMAWCTRDTFIWLGFLLSTIAVKYNMIKGLHWYWFIPFTIPIAMDGVIQTFATMVGFPIDSQFYLSTNFMRMVTGGIFGIGLGSIIAPALKEEFEDLKDKVYRFPAYLILGAQFAILFLVYLLLVQVWRITSPTYPPHNFVDLAVRKSPPVSEWVEDRGAHE